MINENDIERIADYVGYELDTPVSVKLIEVMTAPQRRRLLWLYGQSDKDGMRQMLDGAKKLISPNKPYRYTTKNKF